MAFLRSRTDSAVLVAMICSAAIGAQAVAGRVTRDAFFLAELGVARLPAIVAATALISIAAAGLYSRCVRSLAPAIVVPTAFLVSTALLLVDWLLLSQYPSFVAQGFYLQVTGLAPVFVSGFWSIATERFDPHSARHHFGRISTASTLSGLAAAMVTRQIVPVFGVAGVLPILAVLNLICALAVWQLGRPGSHSRREVAAAVHGPSRSGLRALAESAYLRRIAALVLFGTIGASLAEYVFKARAAEMFVSVASLTQFFAVYYVAVSLVALAVPKVIDRLVTTEPGLLVSTPWLALAAGSIGTLLVPGLPSAVLMYGGSSAFYDSAYKRGYEQAFTPVLPDFKRPAKPLIDVGILSAGYGSSAGLIGLIGLWLPEQRQQPILIATVICAAAALLVARGMSRGYTMALERSLLDSALTMDVDVADITTRTATLRIRTARARSTPASNPSAPVPASQVGDDDVSVLRSDDAERVRAALGSDQRLLAPHLVWPVIDLLAWDAVSSDAIMALRRVADAHVGQLTDALLNPNQPFAVRRRLPRVFSACESQRAVDGLLLGLDDGRFEVRVECGRSLVSVLQRRPTVHVDAARIVEVIIREVAVGGPVWRSRRLIDDAAGADTFVSDFLKDRTSRGFAHIFTLLSLVLPAAPLQIAYRGLHSDDAMLKGTALEYVYMVMPPQILDRLGPFLGDAPLKPVRPREEVLTELFSSNAEIVSNLEELRRRAKAGQQSS